MIQLSNLQSMTSETPVKTGGVGTVDGGFADLLAGEMEAIPAIGGKTLPVVLPASGKLLPGAVLIELPAELPTVGAAKAETIASLENTSVKTRAMGAIVIPSFRFPTAATLSHGPMVAEEADGKQEMPRSETHAPVAAKAIAVELKSRSRLDRTDASASAGHLVDPETVDAETAEDAPAARPAIETEVTVARPDIKTDAPVLRPAVVTEAGVARRDTVTESPEATTVRDLTRRGIAVAAHVARPKVPADAPILRPAIATEVPVAQPDIAAVAPDVHPGIATEAPVVRPDIEADRADAPPEVVTKMSAEVPELLAATAAALVQQAEPVVALQPASEEQLAFPNRAEVIRPQAKREEVRAPNAQQNAIFRPGREQGETLAVGNAVREGTESDNSPKGDGARNQRGSSELRFELSRASGEARIDRAASTAAQAHSIRMPISAASQFVPPEQATSGHGQLADIAAAPVATNSASTSFASQQAIRPHEFNALVDRLVEARETARGGSVDVAVMHADFGEVSLRFRQDASGLSVSMSNSDPEFARAVSEATQADGAQMGDNSGQGARRDEGASNEGMSRSGNSRDWGQSAADANMNGGGRQNTQDGTGVEQVTAQPRNSADEEPSAQDGIYA